MVLRQIVIGSVTALFLLLALTSCQVEDKEAGILVVTGATGQVGGRVVDYLIARGIDPARIIAVGRNANKLEALSERGVVARIAHYENPEELEAAFAGAERVLLIPGRGSNEERLQHHINVIEASKKQGVKHLAAYTFADPDPDSPFRYMPMYVETEEYLVMSGLDYSIMRNTIYMDLLQMFVERVLETGEFGLPLKDGTVAFVTRDDVARAGAAVLTKPDIDPAGIYETSGPEAVSLQDIVNAINSVYGTEVVAKQLSDDDYVRTLMDFGMPVRTIKGSVSMWQAAAENRFSLVSGHIEELTGRRPSTIEEYFRAVKERNMREEL